MSIPKGKKFVGRASEARVRFFDSGDDLRSYYAVRQVMKSRKDMQHHLGAVNRGMYVLIAAMWEAFCEDLAHESAQILVQDAATWKDLPSKLKRHIGRELKDDKDELSAWRLAGNDWRGFALSRVSEIARRVSFNTPKSARIDELFDQSIGLSRVSDSWVSRFAGDVSARAALNDAITRRGGIAHGETPRIEVTKLQLSRFHQLTADLAECTEKAVGVFIAEQTGEDPWRNRRVAVRTTETQDGESVQVSS